MAQLSIEVPEAVLSQMRTMAIVKGMTLDKFALVCLATGVSKRILRDFPAEVQQLCKKPLPNDPSIT